MCDLPSFTIESRKELMQPETGGDLVYRTLKAAGVECVFGIPSQQNLGLYDALHRYGDIQMIGTRHEQAAVHAADGYARATGRLGVAIVSTGPGTANAMNGLYEAGFASSPVLLITTQIDTGYLGRDKGFIHDAEGQQAMLRSVTRCTERVRHVDDIPRILTHVMTEILSGRPQPGAVEIPTDLLLAEAANLPIAGFQPPAPVLPSRELLERAVEQLNHAQRPLIWVGGGAVGAAEEIRQLAERLQAPVVSTANGRGVMPQEHPLYVGNQTQFPAFNELLARADLVLAIGTRFQAYPSQFWQQTMPNNLVHLDVDPGVIGRNYPASLALVGDAAVGVRAMLERLEACPERDLEFLALANEVGGRLSQTVKTMIGPDHQGIVASIQRLLPRDSLLVCDATITANTWGNYLLNASSPRLAHYATSLAIGPALPLAIGAALGTGRKTLSIHGDGGVMLNIGELATAVQYQAPVIQCVFNDQGYGVLRELQRVSTGRECAVDLHTPDFVALAAAMDMPGRKVGSCEDFEVALHEGLACTGPYLIEIDLRELEPIRMFG
ncbi:MAG: acetolactate synthase [Haliea sp.]|nr:acetolactate synthase [Haliea sp.]